MFTVPVNSVTIKHHVSVTGKSLLFLEVLLNSAQALPFNKAMAPVNARGAVHAGI